MANTIKLKRGTRTGLNTLASGNNLLTGEPYLISDEGRLALGLTANTYATFVKQGEKVTFPASSTSASSLNIPQGTAPTSPSDGDVWTTSAGLYVRINGSTIGPLGQGGTNYDVATKAALAALAIPADGTLKYLTEVDKEGWFVYRTASQTANVTADPSKGIFIAPNSASTGASGAWIRVWDKVNAKPEWFGAVYNSIGAANANTTAIQNCINLCPVTLLGPYTYYIDARLLILTNHRTVRGVAFTQTDQNSSDSAIFASSQIISTSASATIIQVGSDSATRPTDLVESVHLENFTVNRSVNPFTTASGYLGSIGIHSRWSVNCHYDKVFSINSARCWALEGTVSSWYKYCSALRDFEGSDAANDTFIGWWVNNDFASGYNGGNASITWEYCRAFPITEDVTPALTYSAGIHFTGGWVDMFVHGFEVGTGINFGIDGYGDGVASTSFRTEDLIVTNCVFDPGSIANIRLQDGGVLCAVTISNCYLAPGSSSLGAVRLEDIAGSVTVSNNQYVSTGLQSVGIAAINVNNLRSVGSIHTSIRQPVYLDGCTNFIIEDIISNKSGVNGDYPAVQLFNCSRGRVSPTISGSANAYPYGVRLWSTNNFNIEVNASTIDHNAIAGGYLNKIYHNTTQVSAPGAFGNNSLATGILNPSSASAGFYSGGAGGGVSDGDKGDVSISGSGTVYTVESAITGFRVGDTSTGSSPSPQNMTLGTTFSDTAGINPKIYLYNDGTFKYGLGVSNAQLDYMAPSGASHAFYVTSTGKILGVSSTGLTMYIGKLTTLASTTSSAGLNLPHGVAPTTPADGDIWTTTTGLQARINGATITFGAASPGGSNTQIQYNNTGAFAGSSNFIWDNTAAQLKLTGQLWLSAPTTDPTAPTTGGLFYAKTIANRVMPKWVGPSGVDYPLQAHIGFNNIRQWRGGATTTATTFSSTVGSMPYTGASPTAPTIPTLASTNVLTQTSRSTISTGATAGGLAYIRANQTQCWRGNAAGLGGFFLVHRFALSGTLQSGIRVFAGLVDVVANPTNIDPTTTSTPGGVGLAINANTGNWKLVNNVTGTARTSLDLGASFPVNNTDMMEVILYCKPNDTQISYRVTNQSTGAVTSGVLTTNIPANTTFLAPSLWVTNNATAAAQTLDFILTYLETDF